MTSDQTVEILNKLIVLVPIIGTLIGTIMTTAMALRNSVAVKNVKETLKAQDQVLAAQNVTLATSAQKLDDLHGAVNAAVQRSETPASPVQVNLTVPDQSKSAN